jgi:hypothetical protein
MMVYQEEGKQGELGNRLMIKISCSNFATSEIPTVNGTTKQHQLHVGKLKRQQVFLA